MKEKACKILLRINFLAQTRVVIVKALDFKRQFSWSLESLQEITGQTTL